MIKQAEDFRQESESLYEVFAALQEDNFDITTAFKSYTIRDVLAHIHLFNYAAQLSLDDQNKFQILSNQLIKKFSQGMSMIDVADEWLDGCSNTTLLKNWKTLFTELSDRYFTENPKTRLPWFGPDMSVLSSLTARLMETWAHGQEVYDVLGIERVETDRIKSIAVLGINTFSWTFKNRQLDVPGRVPYVKLTAPSGDIWEWSEASKTNFVTGSDRKSVV